MNIISMEFNNCNNISSTDIDCDDFDIIIVGGGLTGLIAAYNILKKRAGLSILIIEQQKRVGGSLLFGDVGFYAHSFQKHICRLVKELNILMSFGEPNDEKQRVYFTKNGPHDEISTIEACQVYYFIKSLQTFSMDFKSDINSRKLYDWQKVEGMSVDDFLRQTVLTSKARSLCHSMIYTVCGIDNLKNISYLWLLIMLHNAGGFFQRFKIAVSNNTRYYIQGGMMKIINNLMENIFQEDGIIHCSEMVNKINFNNIRVWVTTPLKTYKCGYVIIAVPPPMSSEIKIEPILSENISITQTLYHTERTVYFQAIYKSFFSHPKYVGTIIATRDSGVNPKIIYNASHKYNENKEVNMLVGFLNKRTSSTSKLSNIFQTINKSFEVDNGNNADNYLQYNEYKCNSPMAVLKPCSIENHINPMLKPLKRIYFAASEYAREFPGTADGAIEAGEHVACFVLHHVRPQVLNVPELMEYLPPKILSSHEFSSEGNWAVTILLTVNILTLLTFLRRAYFPSIIN